MNNNSNYAALISAIQQKMNPQAIDTSSIGDIWPAYQAAQANNYTLEKAQNDVLLQKQRQQYNELALDDTGLDIDRKRLLLENMQNLSQEPEQNTSWKTPFSRQSNSAWNDRRSARQRELENLMSLGKPLDEALRYVYPAARSNNRQYGSLGRSGGVLGENNSYFPQESTQMPFLESAFSNEGVGEKSFSQKPSFGSSFDAVQSQTPSSQMPREEQTDVADSLLSGSSWPDNISAGFGNRRNTQSLNGLSSLADNWLAETQENAGLSMRTPQVSSSFENGTRAPLPASDFKKENLFAYPQSAQFGSGLGSNFESGVDFSNLSKMGLKNGESLSSAFGNKGFGMGFNKGNSALFGSGLSNSSNIWKDL